MAYTIKSTGKPSFKSFDIQCPACLYTEERSVDLRDCETEEQMQERIDRDTLITCPNCEGMMERVWIHAPSTVNGSAKPKSDDQIRKFQQSCKERFVKKELDDVRHKHGRLYDDSVRSAAAQKIKKEVEK